MTTARDMPERRWRCHGWPTGRRHRRPAGRSGPGRCHVGRGDPVAVAPAVDLDVEGPAEAHGDPLAVGELRAGAGRDRRRGRSGRGPSRRARRRRCRRRCARCWGRRRRTGSRSCSSRRTPTPVTATAATRAVARTARRVLLRVRWASVLRTLLQWWRSPGRGRRAPAGARDRSGAGPAARRPRRTAPLECGGHVRRGPVECRPSSFPAPGQQAQDHTEEPACRQTARREPACLGGSGVREVTSDVLVD